MKHLIYYALAVAAAFALALLMIGTSSAAVVVAPRAPSFSRPSVTPVRPPAPARPMTPAPAKPLEPAHVASPSNSWLSLMYANLFRPRAPVTDCRTEENRKKKECAK